MHGYLPQQLDYMGGVVVYFHSKLNYGNFEVASLLCSSVDACMCLTTVEPTPMRSRLAVSHHRLLLPAPIKALIILSLHLSSDMTLSKTPTSTPSMHGRKHHYKCPYDLSLGTHLILQEYTLP